MPNPGKYSRYSFEEFLQDDFFIRSMKNPTGESSVFWDTFLSEYPQRAAEFNAARKFIGDMAAGPVSEAVVAGTWTAIGRRIGAAQRRRIGYSITATAAAACAAILIFFYISPADGPQDPGRDRFLSFISAGPDSLPGGEVSLKLSDHNTVYLPDAEAVITYDSTTIEVRSEVISKEETADLNELVVPYGKRSVLTLEDGTKIWVNAGTRLVYTARFGRKEREIYVDGEIFLDVAPDPRRPFTVHTRDMSARVLGTRFNVQAYPSDGMSRIALQSGSLKVTTDREDVLLSPDNIYENVNGAVSVREGDVTKYISWIDGLYIYQSERLDVIATRLERYYGVTIDIEPSAAGLKCSGKLDMKERIEEVLNVISRTAPVSYVSDGNKYTILTRLK